MTFSVTQKYILFITTVMILACLSNMWAEDLTNEQNEYCSNVHDKVWPDYKNSFEKSCPEWLTEQKK